MCEGRLTDDKTQGRPKGSWQKAKSTHVCRAPGTQGRGGRDAAAALPLRRGQYSQAQGGFDQGARKKTKGRSGLCLDLLFLELSGPRKFKAGRGGKKGWGKGNGGYTPREEMRPFWKASGTCP